MLCNFKDLENEDACYLNMQSHELALETLQGWLGQRVRTAEECVPRIATLTRQNRELCAQLSDFTAAHVILYELQDHSVF